MPNSSSRALQVFAQNLARLMGDEGSPYSTEIAIANRAKELQRKLSHKTVRRVLRMENEPSLDTVEAIAKVFGLEAWQMLLPELQPGEQPQIRRRIAVEV